MTNIMYAGSILGNTVNVISAKVEGRHFLISNQCQGRHFLITSLSLERGASFPLQTHDLTK